MKFIETQARAWHEIQRRFRHNETANGPGSTMCATEVTRQLLTEVLQSNITSMLDAPCGDWNWMQHVNLGGITYTGWDVDEEILRLARSRAHDHQTFQQRNLLTAEIPKVDLILCRDFLIHLPNEYAKRVLDKFTRSGSLFLVATNFPKCDNNGPAVNDSPGYYCRPINLEAPPFNLSGKLYSRAETPTQEIALFRL